MRPLKPRESEFGMALASLREAQGLSVTKLASMAGLSAGYVSQLETGKKPPTSRAIRLLSGALGERPSFLLLKANLIELPWEQALKEPGVSLVEFKEQVAPEERDKLTLYLQFLRFQKEFSAPQRD